MNFLFDLISPAAEPSCCVGFEEMVDGLRNKHAILSTMPDRDCLIRGTMTDDEEDRYVAACLSTYSSTPVIVIYGRNACDPAPDAKRTQLMRLGFGMNDVCIYRGGMFEWMLLRDISGDAEFPATKPERDILRYRPVIQK